MTPFDELTLDEVDQMQTECLKGLSIADADPMALAGAVMYFTKKRDDPMLNWDSFRKTTRMFDIKEFSESMEDDAESDPSDGVTN